MWISYLAYNKLIVWKLAKLKYAKIYLVTAQLYSDYVNFSNLWISCMEGS